MEETDIIICLKKKKDCKNIKKIIVRLEGIFHRRKKPINVLIKVHFKIAITKIFLLVLLSIA